VSYPETAALSTGRRVGLPTVRRCRGVFACKTTFRELEVSKRTFQPNTRRRAKTHGFRLRMRTRAGRAIINNRRAKGRERLAA
jgi:large subunit ribosomal protein L34